MGQIFIALGWLAPVLGVEEIWVTWLALKHPFLPDHNWMTPLV
jgi:hypothetical protein